MVGPDSWFTEDGVTTAPKPKVLYPVRRGQSAPLSEILARPPSVPVPPGARPDLKPPVRRERAATRATPPVAHAGPITANAPAPLSSFDGLSNADNAATIGGRVSPPDVNGDVGPNHYVQWVNLVIAVYDKTTGARLSPPSPGNTPWTGFGGPCASHNDGDPIVLYDQLADRWVFSQFALGAPDGGHQCFAISQTPDPLGAYHLYDYVLSPGARLNDYPKIGIWPDGYYISINEFTSNGDFVTAAVASVDRESMLLGMAAAMVRFDVRAPTAGDEIFSLQPAHLEGRAPPPAGAPNYIVNTFDDETWSSSNPNPNGDRYHIWAFHVDWTDPQNRSSLIGPTVLETAEFDAELCGFQRSCIPQPSGTGLDALAVMTMYRLAYRNFGTHESMVLNHTVDVGGNRAGVQWAEIRNPTLTPELFQTGVHAGTDGLSRWMGSAAMDGRGNIALGYSVANAQTFPGLRYAARLASDPPGDMSQGEAVIVDGSASQTNTNRWGDYFTMSVDETDDCTFWFTGEYASSTTPGDWRTRIASLRLPQCTAAEIGFIAGVVTDADGNPLSGALVATGAFSTVTGADGRYRLTVPAGTYDVTASAFGFLADTATGLTVAADQTVTVDFALEPAPVVTIQGWVHDGTAAGWPLYAKLTFTNPSQPPVVVFTDPDTGWYSVEVRSGAEFDVTVASVHPGYVSESRPLTAGPGDVTAHFALEVNSGTCDALGYRKTNDELLAEGFNGAFPPAGWTVEHSTTGCSASGVPAWSGADPGLRGNQTGGTGGFAIADSDQCGSNVQMSTTLTSPPVDLSSFGPNDGLAITFNQDLQTLPGTVARIEIWDGTQWVLVATQTTDSRGPRRVTFGSQAANGRADARVRFVYTAGWDWWWQIDDLSLSRTACERRLGGLVWGQVTDRNTALPVLGASVTSSAEPPASTFATPEDPAQPDGLFLAFMPAPASLEASATRYATASRFLVPQVNGVRRADFALGAGRIRIAPGSLALRVPFGGTASATLTVTNDGTAPATVDLLELLGVPSNRPHGPFAPAGRRVGPKRMLDRDAEGVQFPNDMPSARTLNAGELVRRIPTNLARPWGIGWDAVGSAAWVGNIATGGGDNKLYRFLADGTRTGETIDVSSYGNVFGADLAYDLRSGMLWQLNVGGDNCIHEVNPVTRTVTGQRICPAFGTTERGLAYDPATDTFYAGSWTDSRIVQFDRSGAILRTVQTQLKISGLAFNPSTGHLFVLSNDAVVAPDVFVLDSSLAPIGQFELRDGATPLFPAFGQAGLELDCAGNLVAVDQTAKQVYIVQSGETGACRTDIPWLSASPSSLTVPAGESRTVTVRVDAATLVPGLYRAQLVPLTSTPYDVPAIGVQALVAFRDVPAGSYGDAEIHGLAGAGITFGCGAGNFCPTALQTRRVFAVWGLRSALGASYVPPRAQGLAFADVAPDSFGADFVEDAARRGLMQGCGDGLFCPDNVVTRGEAAVTLLRLLEGPAYEPPAAQGVFTDVPGALAPFVEDAWQRGLIDECGPTTFCPNAASNRADHAIWLVRTFGFPTFTLP